MSGRFKNKKYHQVDFQVSLMTALIVIVSCYLVFFMNYHMSHQSMIRVLQDRARSIHASLESELNNRLYFDLYTYTDEQKDVYITAKKHLQSVRSATGVRYLYTATVNPSGEFIYVIDGLSRKSADFRHVGDRIEEECIEDMQRAMDGDVVLPRNIARTSWGAIFISYFPIRADGQVIGVLGIEFDARQQHEVYRSMMILTPVIIAIFCFIAMIIAVNLFRHISNPSLQSVADTDFLTGSKSRNAFEIIMNNLDKTQARMKTALISADLDYLKCVNDTYGHAAGDDYICFVSNVLKASLSSNGILYRMGGDEFAVLLTNSSEAQVRQTAEQILENLEKEKERLSPIYNVSLSIGYAIFDPDKDLSLYDTLKRADASMYRQKRRKRSSGYSEEPSSPC